MQFEPGTLVGGRYRLEKILASGGMGSVWRARHVELDSDVAVKVMSGEVLKTPSGEKRFRREAQAAARLQSPHIVRVFDYGVFEGQPYLAMELLAGEDLETHLASQGALPTRRAVEIIDAVAKALQVAHEAGIVHRDLKPANIFLQRIGSEEVVKVLDFGIAKDLGGADASGTTGAGVVGSPAYMSPEQVWGTELGVEADTWAIGVVAYEMLTGENPFMHDVLAQVFDRIVKAKVPSARGLRAGLPETVDAFFTRALARNASDRFHSAKDLAAAFAVAVGDASALGAADPPVTERAQGTSHERAHVEAAETLAARVTHDLPVPRRGRVSVWVAVATGGIVLSSLAVLSLRSGGVPSTASTGAASPPVGDAADASVPVPAVVATPPPSASVSATPLAASAEEPRPPAPAVRPVGAATKARPPAVDPKWGVPVEPRSP